jgi:hypothetical protein
MHRQFLHACSFDLWGNPFLDVGQSAQNDRNLMRIERAFDVPLIVSRGSPFTFDVPKHPGVHLPRPLGDILCSWEPLVHALPVIYSRAILHLGELDGRPNVPNCGVLE